MNKILVDLWRRLDMRQILIKIQHLFWMFLKLIICWLNFWMVECCAKYNLSHISIFNFIIWTQKKMTLEIFIMKKDTFKYDFSWKANLNVWIINYTHLIMHQMFKNGSHKICRKTHSLE